MRPARSRKKPWLSIFPVVGASLEDQDEAVVEDEFGRFPGGALVERGGVIGITSGIQSIRRPKTARHKTQDKEGFVRNLVWEELVDGSRRGGPWGGRVAALPRESPGISLRVLRGFLRGSIRITFPRVVARPVRAGCPQVADRGSRSLRGAGWSTNSGLPERPAGPIITLPFAPSAASRTS